MKARKLPSGSWRAEIAKKDANGKRTRKSFTAATKAEAEAAALAYKLKMMSPTALSIAFGKMLKRNGLPHCRFHDLRHYSASYMHAKGVPSAYIMKRGGWNTEAVLNEVYRHALDDRDKIETKRINDAFTKSLK